MEMSKPVTAYQKVEFWIATAFLFVFVYAAFSQGFSSHGDDIGRGKSGIAYFFSYLLPNLGLVVPTYISFLLLNFVVLPKFWFRKRWLEAVGLFIVIFIITGLIYVVAQSYLRAWIYEKSANIYEANMRLFSRGFSMAMGFLIIYLIYVICRQAVIYQYDRYVREHQLSSRILREVMMVLSLWLVIMVPIFIIRDTGIMELFGPFYFFALPYCIALYFVNLYLLIPAYRKDGATAWVKYFLSLLLTVVVFGLIEIAMLLQASQFSLAAFMSVYWLIPTVAVIITSWLVYWANAEKYRQLKKLQTALGASDANLQYLRAQINPHFLFNALNTLYGTALLEKAEKTGEGIQKLGDMMRFMLHENNMDSIALSRELDYIHNYVDLQNMRLALSPAITVDIQIEDIIGYYEIAPMLLIPFIENAYKHGISHQSRSWINVNLYKRENILHLDVHNSMHPINENDPERDRSGTGLNNVKQRLQLSYPDRHELVIRENGKEFFIHLSIVLTTIKTL